MSYEREFCGLSEYVQHEKLRLLIKSTALFKQGVVDLVYADLKISLNFEAFFEDIMASKVSYKFILIQISYF